MPVFGSHHLVTIVRDAGTPAETRWEARMGGDLDRKALFYLEDRVRTGDQIHYEYFDEPRVLARVLPEQTLSGPSHWRAELMPLSEWNRRNAPASAGVHVNGQGARVNIGSQDYATQIFNNEQSPIDDVIRALAELKAQLPQLARTQEEQRDATVTLQQLQAELQRSRPQKAMTWALMERLNHVGGLGEKVAKLWPLLERVTDWA